MTAELTPDMLVSVQSLTPELRLAAAKLVRLAVPPYYQTLPPETADALIAAEFDGPGTELEQCLAAINGDQVAAILCTYPMSELAERQYNSFQIVGRTLQRDGFAAFAMNLRQLRTGFPEIAGDGTYLAFITVAEEARGTGLADIVLRKAISDAGTAPLFLTVRIDNERARAFYRKHGFEQVAAGSSYAFLCRMAQTTAGGTL